MTLDDLKACTMRHTIHLDGPRGRKGWFGDMHECIQHPRLQRRTRYFRKDRSIEVTWWVDGAEVGPELAAAVALLNQPPALTEQEAAVLAQVGTDFADQRKEVDVMTLLALRSKGMIEFEDGKCRRRESAK